VDKDGIKNEHSSTKKPSHGPRERETIGMQGAWGKSRITLTVGKEEQGDLHSTEKAERVISASAVNMVVSCTPEKTWKQD